MNLDPLVQWADSVSSTTTDSLNLPKPTELLPTYVEAGEKIATSHRHQPSKAKKKQIRAKGNVIDV